MKSDWLKDDIIDSGKLHIIMLLLFGSLSIWLLWAGYQQYSQINRFLSDQPADIHHSMAHETLEVSNIKMVRVQVQSEDPQESSPMKLYATVLNLEYDTPAAVKKRIASNQQMEKQPVYGVGGVPSFLVSQGTISFWRSQLYFETILRTGGLFLLSIIYILIFIFRRRHEGKLFISPIKNAIIAAGTMFMIGYLINEGLNYRLTHFLDNYYYINDLDVAGSSLFYIATVVLILGIWLDQAARLQKEQDLTI